nr:hypothetical protein [Hephaestia mangrovi]
MEKIASYHRLQEAEIGMASEHQSLIEIASQIDPPWRSRVSTFEEQLGRLEVILIEQQQIVGDHRRLAPGSLVDQPSRPIGMNQIIAVEDCQPLPMGFTQCPIARPCRSRITIEPEDSDATVGCGKSSGNWPAIIGRTVIDDQNFDIDVSLAQGAIDRIGKEGAAVEIGDGETDHRQLRHGRSITREAATYAEQPDKSKSRIVSYLDHFLGNI